MSAKYKNGDHVTLTHEYEGRKVGTTGVVFEMSDYVGSIKRPEPVYSLRLDEPPMKPETDRESGQPPKDPRIGYTGEVTAAGKAGKMVPADHPYDTLGGVPESMLDLAVAEAASAG